MLHDCNDIVRPIPLFKNFVFSHLHLIPAPCGKLDEDGIYTSRCCWSLVMTVTNLIEIFCHGLKQFWLILSKFKYLSFFLNKIDSIFNYIVFKGRVNTGACYTGSVALGAFARKKFGNISGTRATTSQSLEENAYHSLWEQFWRCCCLQLFLA